MSVLLDTAGEGLRRTTSLPAYDLCTACGFLKFDSITVGDNPLLCQIFGASNVGHSIRIMGGGGGDAIYVSPYSGTSISTGALPSTGSWIFWALVVNGTSVKAYWAYINATSLTYSAETTTTGSFTPSYLVFSYHPVWAFGTVFGSYRSIRVWDAALTETELLAEMKYHDPQRWANIHLYAPLRVYTDLADYSGNGRTLTSSGTISTGADDPALASTPDVTPLRLLPSGLRF